MHVESLKAKVERELIQTKGARGSVVEKIMGNEGMMTIEENHRS
jgi:hypothetical protein